MSVEIKMLTVLNHPPPPSCSAAERDRGDSLANRFPLERGDSWPKKPRDLRSSTTGGGITRDGITRGLGDGITEDTGDGIRLSGCCHMGLSYCLLLLLGCSCCFCSCCVLLLLLLVLCCFPLRVSCRLRRSPRRKSPHMEDRRLPSWHTTSGITSSLHRSRISSSLGTRGREG